jgi:RHS repeat-associated protein
VIDSGIDFTHSDLANNKWINPAPSSFGDLNGWDYINDSGTIGDEQGHGTAIAGIIAAQGDNGTGISGVMWRASLMSLRVLDNAGTGDVADAVEAIDYATSHGAHVINISWGTNGESLILKDTIERAIRRGVVVVCSAGNSGENLDSVPYYPASFALPDLIAVASSDNFDQLPSWSNWGNTHVTLTAPGTNIITTQMGGGYWLATGTSASAPLVTGVVGLLKAMRPWLNGRQVERALSDGARQVASLSGKVSAGGVVNAAGALQALPGSQGHPPSIPTPGYGSGGTGPGGSFSTTPPPVTTGAPGANLPNLDDMRNLTPQDPQPRPPIQSNLICADCDPLDGGGGGGYHPTGDPDFSVARERPEDETGNPGVGGVDLGSRNFNWSLPLLSLPGRAGMDLNLTLYYNSLVWTKDGSYIKFNADKGNPAVGFRLGLPKLQRRFTNSSNSYSYMLVTSSGGRVELRQVGSSNIYESLDGSYMQLNDTNASAPVLKTSDGTQLQFTDVTINSEFRCTEMKDRNGNQITATYNEENGHLLTIRDTLDREVSFVYDGTNNLTAIRQTWSGSAHDWVTFEYGTAWIAPGFSGLYINGANNNNVTVLTRVNLHDGSNYRFDYHTNFGQVKQINHWAPDNIHRLSYTSYNLTSGAGQTDCPRFTERRDWAQDWNNNAEAVTSYSVATDNSWTKVTAPDLTVYKEWFYTSPAWKKGLTKETRSYETAAAEAADTETTPTWKKKTTIFWSQADENLTYQKNPRVTDTNVYDSDGNRKRVTISYGLSGGLYDAYSLPYVVIDYAADGLTQIRHSYTDYNLSQQYLDRRIIGLVSAIHVSNTAQWQTKITFDYDAGGEYLSGLSPAPIRHDGANYGASFVSGRGNLTSVTRWDVTDISNPSKAIAVRRTGYNITGAAAFVRDALNHQTSVSYADSFSDGNNGRGTFAYPTTVTDADNYQSTTQYRFETGVITKTLTPSRGTIQGGDVQYLDLRMTYDSVGRIQRIDNQNNGAWKFWAYPLAGNAIQNRVTIKDGIDSYYSITVFDGAGRVRAEGGDLPNSSGTYHGRFTYYNVMGRVSQQSNPAEIDAWWSPAGDDSAGWVWTTQTYDWQGRPWVTTLPDGATRENTYGGCGCAGGDVTTVRDERGRRRKLTKDVLGRLKQVDELNWNQSVYSTTTYSYNARDQIENISQAGQTARTFTFDGYGRLYQKTTPEQGTTSYSYFADDTVQTVTDARGATTTFAYNNRDLVTSITYGVPSGVAATPNVSFAYNSAGNRTLMADGLGYVTYGYNTLSQLTSESRYFTGLTWYTLNYSYNLGGEVTSITNPWGAQVGYNYDGAGRPTSVSGAHYGGISSYINSISYRAFGTKSVSYNNGKTLSLAYDNRMRVKEWHMPTVMRWDYSYDKFNENSGRVTYAKNLDDGTLDRSYDYDNVGRMWVAYTGREARWHIGQEPHTGSDGPYAYNNAYDQWGNITQRNGWGVANASYTATYSNNKRDGFGYDPAGNLTSDGSQTYTYDVTGQQATASGIGLSQSYDGDRMRGKKVEGGNATYYLRSSVLGGQVVAEINTWGGWTRGYVYLGGQMVAIQYGGVQWVHQDPVTKSQRITDSNGNLTSTIVDLDPWGGETGRSSNQAFQPHRFTSYERDANGGDDAMMRRYQSAQSRFSQPDPYDGSYNLTDPQSLNRYAYTQNDPVNFVDPSGLSAISPGTSFGAGIVWTTWYGNNNDGWRLVHQWFEPYPNGGVGDDQQGSRELIPPGNLIQTMLNLLENPRCSNFISNIINTARQLTGNTPLSYSASELIRTISSNPEGGYFFSPDYSGGRGGGEAGYATGAAGVTIGGEAFTGTPPYTHVLAVQISYAMTGLHETIHLAGRGYTDQVLAQAAFAMFGDPNDDPSRIDPNSSRAVYEYGAIWDKYLVEYCAGRQ